MSNGSRFFFLKTCRSSRHVFFSSSSLILESLATISHNQWTEWSFCDRFCSCYVLVLGLVPITEFFLAVEADNMKALPSVTRVQCVTRLFLPWVECHSFHFQQVRIQTVPASHLQQGTVSGSTKAVSTVVVTTAPSPKQTQDQLWTLVWKWVALQELPWARGRPPPSTQDYLGTVLAGLDWILSPCLSGVSSVVSRQKFCSKRCCTYKPKCFSPDL